MLLLLVTPLVAQQPQSTAKNPLDQLRNQAKEVFDRAGAPFSPEQEKVIAAIIEERRQASEDLYNQLMDFRGGPVQGDQHDRAVAGIKLLIDEFRKGLRECLTTEQHAVWETYESGEGVQALDKLIQGLTGGNSAKQETQFMRITNNAYTAEHGWYSGQATSSETVQRGGVGAYHGEAQIRFKNSALNARNPFADNKPPYKERQLDFNFSGPVVRNRLTMSVNGNQNESQNVGTVHALTLDGPFDMGVVNPYLGRSVGTDGTLQLSEKNSVLFGLSYGINRRSNQGVGGYTLPDRASNGHEHFIDLWGKMVTVFSSRTLYETFFEAWRDHSETTPLTDAVSIDVLGAFSSGGAQNTNLNDFRNYSFNNLFSQTRTKLTWRSGVSGSFIRSHSFSQDTFLGNFTFSDLDSYQVGTPQTFRVNSGDPLLVNDQIEASAFVDGDLKITRQFIANFGLRYDWQTNLGDHNNIAPRAGFSYALGHSTVIRGGAGLYYARLQNWMVEIQRRYDGTRQSQTVISNPSYPDPFQSGDVTVVPPSSVRVTDAHIVAPYEMISSIALEKTFSNNLFIGGRYEYKRGVHQFRGRNLNAPLPGQSTRPEPNTGDVLNLESTALSRSQIFSVNVRQRFSIFNVSASYGFYSLYGDSDGPFSSPSDNYNLKSDWGRQTQPRHQFNATVNSKFFYGVFLTGTMTTNSGSPYNITTGLDDNFDTNFNDRPAGVHRNSGTGPGYIAFNFNISKAIFFGKGGAATGSGTNLNVFANMTNAFNHTNFGTPSGIMTSSFFGLPTSAQDARQIEVGLRFQF
jgi:hypothetical protein